MTKQLLILLVFQQFILISHAIGIQQGKPQSPELSETKGKIKFETVVHDLGRVNRGEKPNIRFKFSNVGKGPLIIHGVHAACGCAATSIEPQKVFAPGDEGAIDVTFDTKNFRGKVVKAIIVMTNEQILPTRTLTIKAEVNAEIYAEPPLADFGNIHLKDAQPKIIKIKPTSGQQTAVNVTGLKYNQKLLEAGYVKEGNEWLLTIKIKPDVPTGFFKETLYVVNNSQYLKELPVLVRANIKGNIEFSPNYIEFGVVPQNSRSTREIALDGLENFQITNSKINLNINGSNIKNAENVVKISESSSSEKSKKFNIVLTNQDESYGNIHGKITFLTSDPQQKELTVDFYAFFR